MFETDGGSHKEKVLNSTITGEEGQIFSLRTLINLIIFI